MGVKVIKIDEVEYVRKADAVEELSPEVGKIKEVDDMIGKAWFIRTVTYHSVGKLEKIVDGLWIMSNASWVADSGRFMQALKNGTLNEVEPVGDMIINASTIVDIFPWNHTLPREQK